MTSLLELGAGPAWHSTATATALPGAVAVAVDNAAPMLARARERVAHAELTDRVAVVEGDMTSLDATAVIDEATKMNKDAARGEFILITVWAIRRLTPCFVDRL
jgi:tRNA1(Val) A37 N6-methylase TrmN6